MDRNVRLFYIIMYITLIGLFVGVMSESNAQSSRTQYFETWATKKTNQNLVLTPTGTGAVTSAFDFIMTGTGQIQLPSGTTAQRSDSPSSGMLRFNSDTSSFEGYDGSSWGDIGGGGAGSLSIYHQEEFEAGVNASSFTCGTNLTAADDTSTPIAGGTSVTFTQGATPPTVGVQCTGPNIALELKQEQKKNEICFTYTNDHNDDEIAINVYDVTNTTELLQIPLKAASTATEKCGYFTPTSTTANIRYEVEVLVQNANNVLEIDDIEFRDRPQPVSVYGVVSAVRGEGNAGSADTNGAISFTEVSDTVGAWDGNTYTVQKSGSVVSITGFVNYNSSGVVRQIHLYKNGTIYKVLSENYETDETTYAIDFLSSPDEFVAGDTLTIRNAGGTAGNLTTSADNIYISIIEKNYENFVAVDGVSVNDRASTNSFNFDMDSSGTVTNDKYDIVVGNCNQASTGIYDCTLTGGVFSATPVITPQPVENSDNNYCLLRTKSTTAFQVLCEQTTDNTNQSTAINFTIDRAGGDIVEETKKTILMPEGFHTGKAIYNTATAPAIIYEIPGNTSYQNSQISAVTHTRNAFSSISSNTITLPSGEYLATIQAGGRSGTGVVDARLYDGSTAHAECTNMAQSDTSTNAYSSGVCYRVFTLTGSTDLNLQLKSSIVNGQMAAYDLLIEKLR